MGDLGDFLTDNLNVIILIAFVVLPLLLGKKRLKKTAKSGRPPELGTSQLPGSTGKKPGPSMEEKVRRFFEEVVGETGAGAKKVPRPARAEKPAVQPVKEVPDSDFELLDAEPDASEMQAKPPKRPTSRAMPDKRPGSAAAVEKDEYWIETEQQHETEPEDAYAISSGKSKSKQQLDKAEKKRADRMEKALASQRRRGKMGYGRKMSFEEFQRLSLKDLRKAVVMKEILDPPVGLK